MELIEYQSSIGIHWHPFEESTSDNCCATIHTLPLPAFPSLAHPLFLIHTTAFSLPQSTTGLFWHDTNTLDNRGCVIIFVRIDNIPYESAILTQHWHHRVAPGLVLRELSCRYVFHSYSGRNYPRPVIPLVHITMRHLLIEWPDTK